MPPPNSPQQQQHHQQQQQQSHPFLSTVLNSPSSPSSSPRGARMHSIQHSTPQSFTPAQRSAQARGKSYNPSATTTPLALSSAASSKPRPEPESFDQRQARTQAACILDSSEMLMWYAAARNESVAQTRRYYQGVVLGLEGPEVVWKEEWERERNNVGASPARSAKGKERERDRDREREKGKKRVSLGQSAVG